MARKGANKRGLRAERRSIYPEAHPPGSKVLLRVSGSDFSAFDRAMVVCSSLFVIGAVVWVPVAYAWLWKRWSKIPKDQKRRRMWCGALLLALPAVAAIGPHRHPRWGRMLEFRRWRLWTSWLRFVAFEVVSDAVSSDKKVMDLHAERSLLAIIPHGIFPFALGFPALAEAAKNVFGPFRPIVASATAFVPFVKTLLDWLSCIDASRVAVDRALSTSRQSVGLAPGGIAEMFVGYPKPGTHPNEEYAILKNRRGFIRMAAKHGIPIVPIYCFGATKMFRRLQISALERLSYALRVSACVFYGMCGLPIPFRQRLLYVMGEPLYPSGSGLEGAALENEVTHLHEQFCSEISRLFEKHKHSYGWDNKVLKII